MQTGKVVRRTSQPNVLYHCNTTSMRRLCKNGVLADEPSKPFYHDVIADSGRTLGQVGHFLSSLVSVYHHLSSCHRCHLLSVYIIIFRLVTVVIPYL